MPPLFSSFLPLFSPSSPLFFFLRETSRMMEKRDGGFPLSFLFLFFPPRCRVRADRSRGRLRSSSYFFFPSREKQRRTGYCSLPDLLLLIIFSPLFPPPPSVFSFPLPHPGNARLDPSTDDYVMNSSSISFFSPPLSSSFFGPAVTVASQEASANVLRPSFLFSPFRHGISQADGWYRCILMWFSLHPSPLFTLFPPHLFFSSPSLSVRPGVRRGKWPPIFHVLPTSPPPSSRPRWSCVTPASTNALEWLIQMSLFYPVPLPFLFFFLLSFLTGAAAWRSVLHCAFTLPLPLFFLFPDWR